MSGVAAGEVAVAGSEAVAVGMEARRHLMRQGGSKRQTAELNRRMPSASSTPHAHR